MNDNKVLRLFRRLSHPDSRLVSTKTRGSDKSDYVYSLVVGGRCVEHRPAVEETQLRCWLADGRLEPCEAGYRLSTAGRNWLKRRLASEDGFQEQHQARATRVIDFEGSKRKATVVEPESPLRWLASRKDKNGVPLLAPYQVEAGERLRADYEFAGLTARVTASWNPAAGGGSSDAGQNEAAALQDNVMAARQRVVRALAAVGPETSGILVDVCCQFKGLEDAEKLEGWPQRSGKVVLQIALTRLARHYGLISDSDVNGKLRRKLQHWGTEDYRPEIDGGEAAS